MSEEAKTPSVLSQRADTFRKAFRAACLSAGRDDRVIRVKDQQLALNLVAKYTDQELAAALDRHRFPENVHCQFLIFGSRAEELVAMAKGAGADATPRRLNTMSVDETATYIRKLREDARANDPEVARRHLRLIRQKLAS